MRRGIIGAGVPLARVFGLEVRVHLSWILIIAFVAFVLGSSQLPAAFPAWPVALQWLAAGLIAVLLLVSVAAHELAHALTARRQGRAVERVTVFFFGGITGIETAADRPRDEAVVALAGPFLSLGLAIGASLVFLATGLLSLSGEPASWLEAVRVTTFAVASLNLMIGMLNLVPAFPLDGGRLLRAAVWASTGSLRRGTATAARFGSLVGFALLIAGAGVILAGSAVDGLLVLVAGWFLRGASGSVRRRTDIEAIFDGLRIDDVMERGLSPIAPQLTLDTFAAQLIADGERTALPVGVGTDIVGLLGVSDVRRLRRSAWPATRVADAMTRLGALPRLAPSAPLWSGIERLQETGADGLPVMEESAFLGILTRTAVSRALRSRIQARRSAS